MAIRLVAGSFLFLALPLLAQQPQQDPDKPAVTPEQQTKDLNAEKERLQREIQYVKERVGSSKALLSQKLAGYQRTFRSVDAGTIAPPPMPIPAPAPRPTATIATPEQVGEFPNDTIALVNNRPINQAALDRLVGFLRTSPNAGTEPQLAERAMYELLRIEAVTGSFEENAGAERIAMAAAALHDGKAIGELVKEYGTCQGAGPDGKIEVMHNSVFGPMVEMVAFGTPAGTSSKAFRNANGMMIFHCEKLEKGASPELDKVIGYAIEVPYSADEGVLQKIHMSINMGQVQIVVKDAQTMQLLPPMFRPQAPAEMNDDIAPEAEAQIEQALNELSAMIEKAKTANDEAGKAQLQQFEQQHAALKAQRDALQARRGAKTPAGAAIDPKAAQAELQKLQEIIKQMGSPSDDAGKAKLDALQQRYNGLKALLGASAEPGPGVHPVPEAKK